MSNLAEFAGKQLVWANVEGEKKRYELRSGDTVLGNLSVAKDKVTGEIGDDKWTISRQGFFRPRLTVRVPDGDKTAATLEVGALGGGRLVLGDGGDEYRWTQLGMFSSQWGFLTADKQPAMTFKLESGLLSTKAIVTFEEKMAAKPEAALLVMLGWYVLLLYAEDAAPAGL